MPTKRLARIAGLIYLGVAIFGAFAYGYVVAKVYVPGDATTTAQNVVANAGLVRVGVIADLFQATLMVFLVLSLYVLLRHVNNNVGRAMVVLVMISTAITSLNLVFEFAALLVATDGSYVSAFGAAGASALVLLLLDIQHYGYLIAQIFFGLWLVPLGYLAYRSGMFPRVLGIVLVAGGISYVADMVVLFLVPDFGKQVHPLLLIAPILGEVWMVAYLLIRGVGPASRADVRPIGDLAPNPA